MFTFFDANNDGHITFHELKMAMNRCGLFPTKLELRVLLGMGDKDGKNSQFITCFLLGFATFFKKN